MWFTGHYFEQNTTPCMLIRHICFTFPAYLSSQKLKPLLWLIKLNTSWTLYPVKSIRRGGGGSITTTTYRLINQATVETSRKAISATIRVLLSTSTNSAAVLQHRNFDTETIVLCANRRPISSSSKCHFREPNFKTFPGRACPPSP